jgi:hypothetical protein
MKKFIIIIAFTLFLVGCDCLCDVDGSLIEVEPSEMTVISINTPHGHCKIERYTCDINGDVFYFYYDKNSGAIQLERVTPTPQAKSNDSAILQEDHYFDF